jgi:DNA-binding CsgD family transcriptional regulator
MAATHAWAQARMGDLATSDLGLTELGAALSHIVHAVVPHDGYSFIGFDPVSCLRIFHTAENALDGMERELVHNEYVEHDLHRFTDLAERKVPVGTLGGGGRDETLSPRLHELLPVHGFARELRVSLRQSGRMWGALVLLRERNRAPFSESEVSALIGLVPALTDVVRSVSRRPNAAMPSARPAGVVVVNPDGTAAAISAEADAWFADLPLNGPLTASNPLPFLVVEAAAAAQARDGKSAMIRCCSGRWLMVGGCHLNNGQIAVVLQPPTPQQRLPVFAALHDLTPRQCDILELLVAGYALRSIARRLNISEHTVDDHLKSMYRKTSTNSRADLAARLG